MSGHTPGPWKLWPARDAKPHEVALRPGVDPIRIPHGYTDEAIRQEALANACLIAAAPALLEAAKRIEETFGRNGLAPFGPLDMPAWVGLRAAIKAAEGHPVREEGRPASDVQRDAQRYRWVRQWFEVNSELYVTDGLDKFVDESIRENGGQV